MKACLKVWGAMLLPVLLYLLFGTLLRGILSAVGLAPSAARAAAACLLAPATIIWELRERENASHMISGRLWLLLPLLAACLAIVSAAAIAWLRVPVEMIEPSWLNLLGFGLAAPAAEETVYRGLLWRRGERHFGPVWTAILSTVLFAVSHQSAAILPALLGGGLFSLLFLHTHSVLACVIVHALTNLLSFFTQGKTPDTRLALAGLLSLGAFFAFFVAYRKERKREEK